MNLTRELLHSVYSKTQGLCWYCGLPLPPFSDWQVDHQTPKTQGGSDGLSNLVPACRTCNARKGGRTVEEFKCSLLLKLENLVTSAWELAYELEPFVTKYNYPDSVIPLAQTLYECSNTAVGLNLTFYGEKLTIPSLGLAAIMESEGAAS